MKPALTSAPVSTDEQARLAELSQLMIMDSPEEQAYDDITRVAAGICGTPVALITLVDAHRQWFKSRMGTQVRETPKEMAFCTHTLDSRKPMVVADATKDARFEANPLVTNDPSIRFYAGVPLVMSSGHAMGTVCILDTVPREISAEQMEELAFLARQVVAMLELRLLKK